MHRIAPLWAGVDKSGGKFLSGPIDKGVPCIGGMRILIFNNTKRTGKQPEYYCFLAGDDKPDENVETTEETPF